jgi:hypothetical protein
MTLLVDCWNLISFCNGFAIERLAASPRVGSPARVEGDVVEPLSAD